jgi:hypothetical protein
MFVLRRVGAGSAFKVGFVLSGIWSAVFGLLVFVFQLTALNAIMNTASFQVYAPGQSSLDVLQTLSLVGTGTLCLIYVATVVFSAIFGGLGFAFLALIYNLTARMVGGLELETLQSGSGLLDEIEAEMYETQKRM